MASIRIVLRKKRDASGNLPKIHPLALRITRNRKSVYIYLGFTVKELEWDSKTQTVRSSHPNSKRLNAFLTKKKADAHDHSLDDEEATARGVKQKIKPKGGKTFFGQAEQYLANLKEAGKYNQYTADKPRIKHFNEFLQGEDIGFQDISISLLERFKIYLKANHKLSERSIINHLVVIRSVFSQAIKENIIETKFYPFGRGKIKVKFPESLKVGLTAEEVSRVEDVHLEGTFENHCRNLWLIAYYFAGMRVSDVLRLRFSDFQDGRLHYSMGKNNKGGSLKIPLKAQVILNKYEIEKKKNTDFIFPELSTVADIADKFITQRTIAFAVSRIDKCLRTQVARKAMVSKPLTMHIARHTFGNISGDKIPIQLLQKLYRHSSVLTTIGYQANFMHKDLDNALDAVLNGTSN